MTVIFVGIIGAILSLAMIITFFSMSNRLDDVAVHANNIKYFVKILTQQNADLQNQIYAIRSGQVAEQKQYFYDHCFADNMRPHDWILTGQNQQVIEFTCRKCGQKILAPRYLDVEPSAMIQPVTQHPEN